MQNIHALCLMIDQITQCVLLRRTAFLSAHVSITCAILVVLAQATAGQVRNMRQWITNEYKHSGLRDDGGRIFDRLLAMVRDSILPE